MIQLIALCATCVFTGVGATWFLATRIENLAASKADKEDVAKLSERVAVLETKVNQ